MVHYLQALQAAWENGSICKISSAIIRRPWARLNRVFDHPPCLQRRVRSLRSFADTGYYSSSSHHSAGMARFVKLICCFNVNKAHELVLQFFAQNIRVHKRRHAPTRPPVESVSGFTEACLKISWVYSFLPDTNSPLTRGIIYNGPV